MGGVGCGRIPHLRHDGHQALQVAGVVERALGLAADAVDGRHRGHWVGAAGCLGAKHKTVSAVEDTVCNVRCLCTCRPGRILHALITG